MSDDENLYLQFLQNNIARMNSNSAQAKGWCIAIVAALLAIFSETKNELFILICIIPIVLFCILDTLYLQQEHKFVEMYNNYVKNKENKPNVYEMSMTKYCCGIKGFCSAFKSWSVVLVYIPLLIVVLTIAFFIYPKTMFNASFEDSFVKTNVLSSQNTKQEDEVIITNEEIENSNKEGVFINE